MAAPSSPTLILLFHLLAAAAVSASASDVDLLLSFKSSLPNSDVLYSWKKPSSVCSSFHGVSCSSSGDVVSVRLDSVTLNADLRHVAAYLLPISSLVSLSLRNTNVTGLLLAEKCAGTLENVDLSGNAVQGSVTELPEFCSACSGLKLLNLSRNALGFSPRDLNSGAGERQLVAADALDLSFNRIGGGMALGWIFSSAAGVKHLDLSGNRISGTIPAFSDCSRLEYLDVSSNNLSGVGSAGLFSGCERLSFFNVSSNLISGAVPKKLFGSCRSLVSLDMSFNNFSGAVPDDFSTCAALASVALSSNNFSGALPLRILLSPKNLKKLELGYNRFSGVLPESLSKLSSLEVLDLSSNALSGTIPSGLCLAGEGLVGLQHLYLQNNLLTGSIPATISDCSKLVSLDLSFNHLTGAIPASIGALTRLKDLIMWQNNLDGEMPEELGRLKQLENLILDNNGLNGSIPNGLRNCTSLNWVSLSSNRLAGRIPPWIGEFKNLAILKIGNNSLSGPIPPELGDCKSLIWIDLNSNMLNGSIPHSLAKQSGIVPVGLVKGKRYVYLRNDGSDDCHGSGNLLEFAGIRQVELNRMPSRQSCNFTRVYMGSTRYTFDNNGSIIFIDLSYNQLTGEIPKELGDIPFVFIINLGHNLLSGQIPPDLGKLRYLGILDLSHNSLDGRIPSSFSGLAMLAELDLSYNNLSGLIPDVGQLATFPSYRYEHNPGLCGLPLPPCGSNSSAPARLRESHRSHGGSLAGSVAMGLLFSLFCIFGLIVVAVESKKRQRRKEEKAGSNNDGGEQHGREACFDGGRWNSGVGNSGWKLASTKEVMSTNLAAFDNPLRKLTFADLLEATNGFHDDSLIGSGGFGDVYKAELKDGSAVAIKKLIHVSGQGDREFTAEMETIGKIKHRNLVPLLGYCKVGEERLLVYEFMPYGSLEDVLHRRGVGGGGGGVRLNWAKRREIAVGAARGLAFLHHSCLPHIIHRDMKSSNVLLDHKLEARVSDFGMARLMSVADTHLSVSTLAGTPGYVPPEYYQSFRCSAKGDVYSYGVVLLELLTGRQPTDSSDFGDNNLVGWVKQHSRLNISDVFDPDLLNDDPALKLELLEHLKIACACLDDRPLRRPTMLNVMAMLKEIHAAGSTLASTSPPTTAAALAVCNEDNDDSSAYIHSC